MIKAGLWPLVICLVAATSGALADEFRPALLEITETESGWYAVTWNVPQSNGQPLAIAPKFPEQMEPLGPSSTRRSQGEFTEKALWRSGYYGRLCEREHSRITLRCNGPQGGLCNHRR